MSDEVQNIKLWSVISCHKIGLCTGKNEKQKSKDT